MKLRNHVFEFALLISVIHCVLGNLIGGSYRISSNLLDIIFLPYSFIAGMSNFAGWDSLSVILEVFGFIFMTFLFYVMGIAIRAFVSKK